MAGKLSLTYWNTVLYTIRITGCVTEGKAPVKASSRNEVVFDETASKGG